MSLVKVSVENVASNDKILHEIDTGKSLEENIDDIRRIFQLVCIFLLWRI